MDTFLRLATQKRVQARYTRFEPFLEDMMYSVLGFKTSVLQKEIAKVIAYGDSYRLMIQAQRGEAKTTISAFFAVWSLIREPWTRVLIFSAGEDMASEIASLIYRTIMTVDFLEYLRPDRSAGHRTSASKFDVHHDIKRKPGADGVDKSPSVTCLGITSNMQGKRGDLIIPDDIESQKNSVTAAARATLLTNMDDFISITGNNPNARILYLGTPQTSDSVYNSLDQRGFKIHIFPARYPTVEQEDNYGDKLSVYIKNKMREDPSLQIGGGVLYDQGKPTDPEMFDEDILQKKEMQQSAGRYHLQQMLNTALLDADRYPLYIERLIMMDAISTQGVYAQMPSIVSYNKTYPLTPPTGFHPANKTLYKPGFVSDTMIPFDGVHMFIDPSGGGKNGDETGWAVSASCNGYIFVLGCGGLKGGVSDNAMDELALIAKRFAPNNITIETNYGGEMFMKIFMPYLNKHKVLTSIEDSWATGQKELRIIDTLEPLISTHRIIFNTDIIKHDISTLSKYAIPEQASYSLFYQMAKITRDRGALSHDDRLDALAGTCTHWVDLMDIEGVAEHDARQEKEFLNLIKTNNPLYADENIDIEDGFISEIF